MANHPSRDEPARLSFRTGLLKTAENTSPADLQDTCWHRELKAKRRRDPAAGPAAEESIVHSAPASTRAYGAPFRRAITRLPAGAEA